MIDNPVSIIEFIHSFVPLINAHSNDFLVKDLWNTCFSKQIVDQLENLDDPTEILRLYLNTQASVENINLQSNNVCWDIYVNPNDQTINRTITSNWKFVKSDILTFINLSAKLAKVFPTKLFGKNENILTHGMSIKKSYEIDLMSHFLGNYCQKENIETIVDIGSGKGYLGTELSLGKGINVIEVDSRESNKIGAEKRRSNFKIKLDSMQQKSNLAKTKEGKCVSLTINIKSNDKIQDFIQEVGLGKEKQLITGLHCCGGLSVTILRNFVNSSNFKSICFVGCCYHLLNERFIKNFDHSQFSDEFPLSKNLIDTGVLIGKNGKNLSAQSVKRIASNNGLSDVMFYRVLLEQFLMDYVGYVSEDWKVGCLTKKLKKEVTFSQYIRLACKKFKLDFVEKMSDAEIEAYQERYPELRRRFSCFFYLRCCLAPLLETLIVWDRLEYLRENGIHNAEVMEMFDEIESPRRYVIVASKPEQ